MYFVEFQISFLSMFVNFLNMLVESRVLTIWSFDNVKVASKKDWIEMKELKFKKVNVFSLLYSFNINEWHCCLCQIPFC